MSLTTIEVARPGDAYTLTEHGLELDVHLAGPGATGGTGPCLCGYDRHAHGGFSVGGGVTGLNVEHHACPACFHAAGAEPISGLHARLFDGHAICSADGLADFEHADQADEDTDGHGPWYSREAWARIAERTGTPPEEE